ncbi:hypothetical protein V8F20_005105 [Naviculisporaceae sp. PSN 640]
MQALFGIPELVIHLLQQCDGFQDAIALASTCKVLASIWRAHFPVIIWPVAQAEIPGFSQALMAARATKLVCDAFEANRLPPDPFPLQELSGIIRKPDLEDIERVFDLRHFVRCVEQMSRDWEHVGNQQILSHSLGEEEYPREWETMRDHFHTAMYRVLYVGAALTRPYLEPLLLAPTEAPPDLLRRLGILDNMNDYDSRAWRSEDLRYFGQFPIYDFEASDDKWEPVFGDVARFLLNDIKTTATATPCEVTVGSESPSREIGTEEGGWLKETIYFLAAYEHMRDKLFHDYIKDPDDENLTESDFVPPLFPDNNTREVSIAMFGRFRPERISMPAKVKHASHCYLVNFPLGHYPRDCSLLPKVSAWNTDINALLHGLWMSSGCPNHRDNWKSPPPELRFLEFFMRKVFRVGFRLDLFGGDYKYFREDYTYRFLSNINLFGDGVWYQLRFILNPYRTPTLSYRALTWGD